MALGSTGGMRWIQDRYYLYDPTQIFNIGKLKADGTRDYSMLTFRGSVDYRYQYWDIPRSQHQAHVPERIDLRHRKETERRPLAVRSRHLAQT